MNLGGHYDFATGFGFGTLANTRYLTILIDNISLSAPTFFGISTCLIYVVLDILALGISNGIWEKHFTRNLDSIIVLWN